jgi:hypothetical protein
MAFPSDLDEIHESYGRLAALSVPGYIKEASAGSNDRPAGSPDRSSKS